MSRPPFRPYLPAGARPLRGVFVGALLLLLLAACKSDAGGKSPDGTAGSDPSEESDEPSFVGPPSRVTWTLYKTGQQITLVNETHTDPLDYYSDARQSSSTKIQTDEIVAALIEFFGREGFDRYASPGAAPAAAIGQTSQSLEVEVEGQRRHVLWGVDRPEKERDSFVTCRDGLMEIWNATYAAQSVENERGEAVFGTSKSTTKKKDR